MEVIYVLSFVTNILLLVAEFQDLVKKKQITEKDKDNLVVAMGELLRQLQLCKELDANFENFAGEELEGWLSQLNKSRNFDTIERIWKIIYERFDKIIVQQIEPHLSGMEALASNKSDTAAKEVPIEISKQVTEISTLYPGLIKLTREFIDIVRTQNEEIENKNYINIGKVATDLDTRITRIKSLANTVLRALCSVVIYTYGKLLEGIKR